jgi:Family of unknown function (DUF6428)
MNLSKFKEILHSHSNLELHFTLPNGESIPQAFHITEVGYVTKKFMDCGGRPHQLETCLLQTWIGPDIDHRLTAKKLLKIIEQSSSILPHDYLPVEIEHESILISQYSLSNNFTVSEQVISFILLTKHADCLAKDVCLPQHKSQHNFSILPTESCCQPGQC